MRRTKVKWCEKGGEEDTFSQTVRGKQDPADQYMEKKEEDTFSERGGIKEEVPACDTLMGPTCESESEEEYFQ